MNSASNLARTGRWLAGLVRPYVNWIFFSAFSALTLVGFNILRAGLVARLVENALQSNINALTRVVLMLIPAAVLAVLATWVSEHGSRLAAISAMEDLRNKLVNHITRADVASMERFQSGELFTRLNKDVKTVGTFLSGHFPNLVYQPLMFLGSSIYLLSINWKLFSACYILLPFTFTCAALLNKKGAGYAREYLHGLDQANNIVKQCINGIVTVKSYNLENHLLQTCRQSFANVLRGLMKKELCDALSLPFYFLTYESPRILCILTGAYLTLRGEMSIGELLAATQLVSYVSAPAFALMRLINGTRQTEVAVGRLQEILAAEAEPRDHTIIKVSSAASAVEFRNITYGYNNAQPVLRDFNLTLPARGLTALVGASGGGKTTIISLLCGFYRPESGRILAFGQDVTLSPVTLRSLVSFVPQDSTLFPGTILENICLGNPAADEEEVHNVVRGCAVKEFADSLPQGLNTVLGENGRGLSGGQQQRVAIARAALKSAPVLVLDEPTSALDPVSEVLVNRTLRQLAQRASVLVVSHRLSTVREASRIIVLAEGTVAEQGSYDSLIGCGGVFSELFKAQIQEGRQGT